MNELTKIERAIRTMPYEIIAQNSNGTDDVEVLIKNAETEGTPLLQYLLEVSKETLSTYQDGGGNTHVNYEMQEDDYSRWVKECKELKLYIAKLKNYLK